MSTALEPATDEARPVLDDLAYLRTVMVNVYFIGPPDAGDREWILVDAGMPGSADLIARAAEARFGASRPAAIVLTHSQEWAGFRRESCPSRLPAPICGGPMPIGARGRRDALHIRRESGGLWPGA